MKHATPADFKRWRHSQRPAQLTSVGAAVWFQRASNAEREALLHAQHRSKISTQALTRALKDFKGLSAFAEPLLKARLKEALGEVKVDVNTTQLVEIHYEPELLGAMLRLKPRQQSLMQAALQNFAANSQFAPGSALTPKDHFSLELIPTPEGTVPRFQYSYTSKLPIKPEQFATLCHELDLGGKYQAHISEIYENPRTRDTVRKLSIDAYKDHLRQAVQIAFMKGEISASAREMFNGLLDGQRAPLLHGKPVSYQALSMFGSPLHQVLIFSANRINSNTLEPVIAYLPGAPLYPLKEYRSAAEFKRDLRTNLLNPAYLELFRGYVAKHEHAHFFKRLDETLYDRSIDVDGQLDPHANLHIRDVTIEPELFGYVQDQQLQRLKANARDLAVPSAEVDEAAKRQRLAYWESIGFNVLNAAAFFVPGVGEVMAVVAGAQLVKEVIDGAHAWEAGELDEALAHFESVAMNVALVAGFGAAGHVGAPVQASERVDGLLRVTLPGGEQRLWKPDLLPYTQTIDLAGIAPDAQGLYTLNGSTYIRIEEQVCEVSQDADGAWSIRHPNDPDAYQPALRHNREGAWQAVGEQPLQWSHIQLLRRIGHATRGLSDDVLEQAAQISGINDDVLRSMHIDQLSVPPLLGDTLRRFQIDRRVTRLIDSLRSGEAEGEGLGLGLELSLELARWPERVLEVYDPANPDRGSMRYGANRWPNGRVIRISVQELYANQLADKVLADLNQTEALELFGSSVEPDKRLAVLRQLIAERAVKRRDEIYQIMDQHGHAPRSTEQQRLIRDFPLLTDAAAQEIISAADAEEHMQLQAVDGRVPMRLAEEARVYQRQFALSRAIQGLHEPTLANLDSDRLAVGLMAQLPGWTDTVCIQLREERLTGRLLANAGPPQGELKSIVRSGRLYTAYDAQGLELSNGESLFATLLKALPDSEREAVNLDIYSAQSLRLKLCAIAVEDRAMAATLLGQQPIRPWFRSPLRLADGRAGYPLGGVVSSEWAINSRLNALFPELRDAELEALKRRLLDENQTMGDAIFRLEGELNTLQRTLDLWVEGARGDFRSYHFRRGVREQLLSAWRRQGGPRQSELQLGMLGSGSLPTLTARFEHIQSLTIHHMNLEQFPDGFLRCFPRLQHLSLEGTALRVLPAEISALTELNSLDLTGVRLTASDTMFDALTPLVRLRSLELQSNQLHNIPDAAVETLSRLPALTRLNLRYNRGLSNNGLAMLTRLPLQYLDLSSTGLVLDQASAQVFSRFVHLQRLRLGGNPLGEAPELGSLVRLEILELDRCELREWPVGLTTLMNQELRQLRTVDLSRNLITQLPDLAATRFGSDLRAQIGNTLRLNLSFNPLEAQSIMRLRQVRGVFAAERSEGLHPRPGSVWLVDATQAQSELWDTMFQSRRHAALEEMLERLAASREFQRNAPQLRARVWKMLELASQHNQLREELQAIAEGFPVTCGDAGADAFSDLETAVLVFESSAQATLSTRRAELLALYRQLFRRHEVKRMADKLSLARMARRRALLENGTLPDLDPLDDISDGELRRHPVEDIEIRLALRQDLANVLNYPEPSSGMLYRDLANVTPNMVRHFENAVRAVDTTANRHAWMVEEISWQRYLRQHYAQQLDEVANIWSEGLAYLDYCNGAEEMPGALSNDVLQVLRTALNEEPVAPDGALRRLEIGSQQYEDAANAVAKGQKRAETEMMVRLTQLEEETV
ncbi:NEL-type E3 ubiquitin ligase domain-containing protein [Pseudomonas sp. BBP2017]|uniref:NEL-type E3 ubiquitin ligase domain-containing protein n=1 Tax=Pseudomonas sp. BBP2017 TaxID=2109731 RepID=UPI001304A5E7|nr:NEL-type E3 ubiquitin ligase domain-containing protein [Pseudomonas sp. BBP2017]